MNVHLNMYDFKIVSLQILKYNMKLIFSKNSNFDLTIGIANSHRTLMMKLKSVAFLKSNKKYSWELTFLIIIIIHF